MTETRLQMKYFVLKPRSKTANDHYAYASRQAMYQYADIIALYDHEMAKELREWADHEAEHARTLNTPRRKG